MIRFFFRPSALAQVRRLDSWWLENRHLAPELFRQELRAAIKLLREAPYSGGRYDTGNPRRQIRRLLLPGCQHHLYYLYEPAEQTILVLALWSARRGKGPRV